MNNSIRGKIQQTLVYSILIVSFFSLGLLYFNQQATLKSQKVIETMTLEYQLITHTDDLIQDYNEAIKSNGDPESLKPYLSHREQLLNSIATLKSLIISPESRSALTGVENTIKKVIEECDLGIKEVEEDNYLNISNHFLQANINNEFVRDNTRNLLQKELEYLSKTQEATKKFYRISLYVSLGTFLGIIFFLIIYSRSFSKLLIGPIEQLTVIAKQVASGIMDTPINKNLVNQNDEVGVLSKSFLYMLDTLKTKIKEVDISNQKTAEKNIELEKLNEFMVNRELKMVELKKRISELQAEKKKK